MTDGANGGYKQGIPKRGQQSRLWVVKKRRGKEEIFEKLFFCTTSRKSDKKDVYPPQALENDCRQWAKGKHTKAPVEVTEEQKKVEK